VSQDNQQAEAGKRRWVPIVMWSALAAAIGTTLIWRFTAPRKTTSVDVSWACVPEHDREVTCGFHASDATAGLCFDLVLDCDDGEHRTRVCSGALEAGEKAKVAAGEFIPPLPAKPVCRAPRYENRAPAPE